MLQSGMHRILPVHRSHRLHASHATRALEAATQAALPVTAATLMERAGLSLARLALAIAPHADRIWIAAGPGNNGGDGIEAATRLHAQGRRVHLTLTGDAARLPTDAAAALRRAHAAGLTVEPRPPQAQALNAEALAIDALLGLGSARAPPASWPRRSTLLNRLACPVLAVDLPTGIDPDTGRRLGEVAVRASHTLSLLTLKPGLFTGRRARPRRHGLARPARRRRRPAGARCLAAGGRRRCHGRRGCTRSTKAASAT